MSPGLATVERLVNPVTNGKVGSLQAFTATYIDNLRVGGGHSNAPNRACGLTIKDRVPGMTEVGGFPYSAVGWGHEKDVRLCGNTVNRDGAASSEGANETVTQLREVILRDRGDIDWCLSRD